MTLIHLPGHGDVPVPEPPQIPEPEIPDEPAVRPAAAAAPAPGPQPPARDPGEYDPATELRPVFPDWMTDLAKLQARLELYTGRVLHQTAFHAVRIPLYVIQHNWWALRGARILTGRLFRWWFTELHILEGLAIAQGRSGHSDAIGAHQLGNKTRSRRGRIIGICAAITLVLAVAAWAKLPRQILVLAGLGIWYALAWQGKPEGKSMIERALIPPKYQKPTRPIITVALHSIDIKGINDALREDGAELDFRTDVMESGQGWGCDIELPHGVTAGMVIARRDRLASGLRRPLSAVWPEKVPEEHEGYLRLWIAYHDMAKQKQPQWPLLRAGQSDFFEPVPFATTPRGQIVNEPLFQANWLVGANPGEGKTNTVRVLGCVAALDPLIDLWVHELAGKSDLEIFSKVAHRYVSGLDDEAVLYALESLQKLEASLKLRSRLFRNIPLTERPDGALTRALAERDKRLRPVVAIFDEIQNLFTHPRYGKEAQDLAARIIRIARAYGIVLILATQRPDADCLPTNIRDLCTIRFCLKVGDATANNMILGAGAYAAGYNSVLFRHEVDAGLGWLKGTADPSPVKTFYLKLTHAERVTARARTIRERAGVITGYAAGDDTDEKPRNFLADVLAVFHGDEKLWSESIALRLSAEMKPVYAGITGEAVGVQLRAEGVKTPQVRETGAGVRAGCYRSAVEERAGMAATDA